MGFVVAERGGARLMLRARDLRGEASLTQIAQIAGIRQDDLGKIERGETHSIRFETLLRLCRAFGVSPGELFELDDSGTPPRHTPLGAVLTAVEAGRVTLHQPPSTRRRLRDGDVLQDLDDAGQIAARAQVPVARGRRRVPLTGP